LLPFFSFLQVCLSFCVDQTGFVWIKPVLSAVGNLTLPNLDFARILKEFELIDWMKCRLVANSGEDDLILEIVVFVGTCAADEAAAMYICRSGVLPALIDLLKAKQEDDEIVLQVLFLTVL
jgi:hypothetical protein